MADTIGDTLNSLSYRIIDDNVIKKPLTIGTTLKANTLKDSNISRLYNALNI